MDAVVVLLAGVSEGSVVAAWVEFMSDKTFRWPLTGAIGATWMFLTWTVGQWGLVRRIPREGRKFFPLMVAGPTLPLAFLIGHFVPGLVAGEVALAMTGGTLGSHAVHKWLGGKVDQSRIFKPRGPE